ncbi:MAG: YihA family ribosome biogenesis GTP-binding protein [Deltaproteobacteria bacterium]|nr:YihA family ribosome biogenesis GTP-binding protein [Deltaproteobacteria bacterium]
MKIVSAEFVLSAYKSSHYPNDDLPEVVLIGRSNVGKSSLINSLVNRKGLAKTSSAPGKTRSINFYRINNSFYVVDLPGFGYANCPKKVQQGWEKMIEEYLECRPNLKGVFIILDPRRDATDVELSLYAWIERLSLPVATVLTKTDKLSRSELARRTTIIKQALGMEKPVLFSSITGVGVPELGNRIREMTA